MIQEFLSNPRAFNKPIVPNGESHTVEEFVDRCVIQSGARPAEEAIRHWHELLSSYSEREDAILLSRLYENEKERIAGEVVYHTRRGALTVMADGFSYAFCSNFFARVIYSMALANVLPCVDEFAHDMTSLAMRIGHGWGMTTAVDRLLAAYPLKPYSRKFYLDGWYLAHIHAIDDEVYEGHEMVDVRSVYALGQESDWNQGRVCGQNVPVRRLDYYLNERQKAYARAQFLRFLDPLNYFLVPRDRQISYDPRQADCIGSEQNVVCYMKKFVARANPEVYADFRRRALISVNEIPLDDIETLGAECLNAVFRSYDLGAVGAAHHFRRRSNLTNEDGNVDLKISRWARDHGLMSHKIIRAFLKEEHNGHASKVRIEDRCSNRACYPDTYVEKFKGNWGSLKRAGGHQNGQIFIQNADDVVVNEMFRDAISMYRDEFLRDYVENAQF